MTARLALFGALLFGGGAAAQAPVRTCLPDNNAGNGLALAVDPQGVVHLSRIRRLPGTLVHTTIGADGVPADTVLTGRVSPFAAGEVDDTDLLLEGDEPRICFRDALADALRVALRADGGWRIETVTQGGGAGAACALGVLDGELVVGYSQGDALWWGARRGQDDWRVEPVHAAEGDASGLDVDLAVVGDTPVLAHRDRDGGRLFVSWRDGEWQTREIRADLGAAGLRPVVTPGPEGTLAVTHGARSGRLDADGDGGLLLSTGTLGGGWETHGLAGHLPAGGAHGAGRVGEALLVFTRERRRSALFGQFDALLLVHDGEHEQRLEYLEQSQFQRHLYLRLAVDADPFGLPVLAWLDDAAPFGADPGGARVCLRRPADRDGDGLPDVVEPAYGTDPDLADTDGDGRSDGDEVLRDGTDPTRADGPEPPEPDAAVPDAAVDAAVPDAALPDAAVDALPDAAVDAAADAAVDAAADAAVDAEVTPPPFDLDAAQPDAEPPPRDAAAPLPDAEPPRRDAAAPIRDSETWPQDTETPVGDSETSPQDTETPVGDSETSPQDTETPIRDGEPPLQEDAAPTRDGEPQLQDAATPFGDGEPPLQDDAAPTRDGEPPLQADAAPNRDAGAPLPDAAPPRRSRPVRFDGGLPPLETYTSERNLGCSCENAGAGGRAPPWALLLLTAVASGGRRRREATPPGCRPRPRPPRWRAPHGSATS